MKFRAKSTLLKITLSIFHLLILNSIVFFFSKWSLKSLDFDKSDFTFEFPFLEEKTTFFYIIYWLK